MNRRKFLNQFSVGIGAFTFSSFISSISRASSQEKPNILWLDTEDLSPDLACYGNPYVATPNLDKLAAEGIRFTNAFVTCPVCSPSRSAMATGMYQTTIGAHNHRSHRDDGFKLPDGVTHFSFYLKKAGYFVANGTALNPDRQGKLDFNFNMNFKEAFDGTDWSQRKPGQPFFIQLHFNETHRTFTPDPENPIDPDKIKIPPYYPDHPLTRLDWSLYLEMLQVLDKKVGKVLQRLEDEGIKENTVIFFTGDHGRPMVRAKQWCYDSGIHVPLIIRWPGKIKAGEVKDNLVSLLDLAPTFLKIAGVDPPSYMQGRDLLGTYAAERKYIFSARDRCDETDDRVRCVRSKRFKYLRNFYPERPYQFFNAYKQRQYPVLTLMKILDKQGKLTPAQKQLMAPHRPVEELYNIQADPFEINNLANETQYFHILKEMRAALDKWICETGDKGQMPEDPEVAAYWDRTVKENDAETQKKRGTYGLSDEDYLKWWENELKKMKKGS
jgi:N-sulfoglucosamine sulfohydrolase